MYFFLKVAGGWYDNTESYCFDVPYMYGEHGGYTACVNGIHLQSDLLISCVLSVRKRNYNACKYRKMY